MKSTVLYPMAACALFVSCSDSPVSDNTPVAKPTPAVQKAPSTPVQVKKPETTKPATKPGSVTSIDVGRVFTMKQSDQAHVIDVRPPLYYRLGHIDGADSMPLIKFDKVIASKRPQLDAAVKAGKVIVLYCQNSNCPDAHKTAVKLAKLGYSTSVYRGGWEEWKQAGLE
ncbi:hypothetical protein NT6N_00030 [Oceaniferula spumae]|uniref:Rhodanese domain-containing protein n=1 Tax=Oceaniferula spumae TaxID=2979115 RepID=A0AAT9FG55_9BACT